MKKFKGFSTVGAIVALAIIGIIAVGTYIVIDGNNKATNSKITIFIQLSHPIVAMAKSATTLKVTKMPPPLSLSMQTTNVLAAHPSTHA